MGRYVLRRIGYSLITLLGLITIVFVVSRLLGDPVRLRLPLDATNEQAAAMRTALGLDRPILVQFGDYLTDVLRGDLGDSLWQGVPALGIVLGRLGPTLQLAVATVLLSVLVAIPIGAVAALRPRSVLNRLTSALSMLAISVPNFWFALILILIFAVTLHALPTSGTDGLASMVLPVVALSLACVGRLAEMTRATVQDEMLSAYVVTARAKGASERRILFGHVLKNAAMPVLTVTSDQFVTLVGGIGAIELIFGWPGIGWASIDAINRRDFPVIQAAVLVIGVMVIAINLVVDLLYTRLDPRVRVA